MSNNDNQLLETLKDLTEQLEVLMNIVQDSPQNSQLLARSAFQSIKGIVENATFIID